MSRRREANLLYPALPALIVVITIVAGAVAALALVHVRTHLIALSGESLALAASDVADKLDIVLYERHADIQNFAKALTTHSQAPQDLSQTLIDWQQVNPIYLWLAVTDETGRVIAATDRVSVGQDRSRDAWFATVRGTPKELIEDAQPFPEAKGLLAVSFTAPLQSPDGRFAGVITARVGLPALETILARTVRLLLTDRGITGRLEWQLITTGGRILVDSTVSGQPATLSDPGALPSAYLLAAGNKPGYVEELSALHRVPMVTGYARTEGYGTFRGLPWGIRVSLPRKDVLAPIMELQWQIGIIVGLVWGPLFLFLLWSSLRLNAEGKAARSREQRLATTLATITDAVFITDRDGRLSSMNEAAETLSGRREIEARGTPVSDLLSLAHKPSGRRLELPIAQAIQERAAVRVPAEVVLRARQGPERFVEGNSAPLKDDDGAVIGGLLVLRDVTDRVRLERRRAAQFTVTRILSESSSLAEAGPRVLQAICESLDWEEGALWQVDSDANLLRCSAYWHRASAHHPEFEQSTRETTFAPGIGLPGRVWKTRGPAWIPDVCQDPNFPRAPYAKKAGLHAAFGFPIKVGDVVIGVFEFFSGELRQPDTDLLDMLRAIGTQVGMFCRRTHLEAQALGRS